MRNKVRVLLADFFDFVAGLIKLLMFAAGIIIVAAFVVAAFVGAWDALVWLFKADWRTTNFNVPKTALMVFGGALGAWVSLYLTFEVLRKVDRWIRPGNDNMEEA